MTVALTAFASYAMAGDRRDIVFDCPCSAEWVAGESGEPGRLTLRGGIRSYRATESGEVRLSAHGWGGTDGVSAGQLPGRHQRRDRWTMAFAERKPDAIIELHLLEQTGQAPGGRVQWRRHETLALWPVPQAGESGRNRFVDILTDSDSDGVGDVNERLAGTSVDDPESTAGTSVVDVLALYSAEFSDAESDYPYTRMQHDLAVARALFEDNHTDIQLRTVGMSEVELDENGWARNESRQELMESHGADLSIQYGLNGPCSGPGCAIVGAYTTSRWSDAQAWVNGRSALTTAHEFGHAMGLTHSARQGEDHGAWRWSRGHYVTPRGCRTRHGTIMAYGTKVLGGVFSNPLADCGAGSCGVSLDEVDGADSVATLGVLRFQVAAHRVPATDTDGDGFVDAADAAPKDPGDWSDIDGDGIGDNADPDDDNDGTPDVDDAFPLDPDEWADVDPDGLGDNEDDDVRDLSPFRDPALRAAVETALGLEAGAPIAAEDMASLKELRASGKAIRDLTGLETAFNLGQLELSGNRIVDLAPLARLSRLKSLNLSSNRIVDLAPLSGLLALQLLWLSHNPIVDIAPLRGLVSCLHLSVSNTRVAYVDVRGLPYFREMRSLGLAGLGIEDVSALAELPLEWLSLAGNPISNLSPLSRLTAVRNLDLSNTGLTDIEPLAGLTNLGWLNLWNNRITDVSPLIGMDGLSTLNLAKNVVSGVGPLKGLVNLEWLDLQGNRISDVSPLWSMVDLRTLMLAENAIIDIEPLKRLVNLKRLDLQENRISDVSPLSTMQGLRTLKLEKNAISDIGPLVDRSIYGGAEAEGAYVGLDGNPLGDASMAEHISTLRSWGIRVHFDRRGNATEVPIVDPTLRALVAESVAGGVAYVDDDASTWPIERIDALSLAGRGITNLAGLEAAHNLSSLHAASNLIADLAPLAELLNLEGLDLRNNRISDISPLVANTELAEGDWVALDGNPLSEESLNTHVPALLERGVEVSVGSIAITVVAGGQPLRFDMSGYLEAVLGAGFDTTVSMDDALMATAEVVDGVLVVTPGSTAGRTTVTMTMTATNGSRETETLTFAVTVRTAWVVPYFPSASDPVRQGFLRAINHGQQAGEVRIAAIDDTGSRQPPLTFAIGPGEAVHFNSADLETGNPDKGLTGSSGSGTGDWRLELESALELEVLSYIRTRDGFLTAMSEVAPVTETRHRVPMFNPASNLDQVSSLRLTNHGNEATEAMITGVDDRGESPKSGMRVDIPPGATVTLTAAELEAGVAGARGMLGDGRGKWRLWIVSDGDLTVMNLLTSPEGHVTNLSTEAAASLNDQGVHTVPLFPSAADALGRQGSVRVINHSPGAGKVRIQPHDDTGRRYEPLTLTLGGGEAAHFNSNDLELGRADKELSGSAGSGVGDWRLELSSELDIEVLAYIRTPGGFLTAMHDLVFQTGRRYDVATFNPGDNTSQVSKLRIVNPGSRPAHVSVAAVDDEGKSSSDVVRMTVPAGEGTAFTAAQFETGAYALQETIGAGKGKWQLQVDSEQPIFLMNLLESPTGHLTNLSKSPANGLTTRSP